MKKLFGILTIVALVTTAAFAQEEEEGLSFSASGRALWIVAANSVNSEGDPAVVGDIQNQNGGPGPRNDFIIKGTSEHIGFQLDLRVDGGAAPKVGDNALIWVKPFSWARLVFAGAHDENVASTGATWGLWNWDRIGVYEDLKNDDDKGNLVATRSQGNFIFPDLLDKTFSLEITPIEGLLIAGALDLPFGVEGAKTRGGTYSRYDDNGNVATYVENGHDVNSKWYLGNIFGRNGSLVIAYTAAEIVTVKFGLSGYNGVHSSSAFGNLSGLSSPNQLIVGLQHMGKGNGVGGMWQFVGNDGGYEDSGIDYNNPVIIDAAVEATPIEGLTLALGAHAPTVSNNFVGGNWDPRITFLAKVGMVENLNIGLRFGVKFLAIDANLDKWKVNAAQTEWDENGANSVGFTVGLGADYTFDGPGVNIFLDVGYADGIWMANNSSEGYDSFTIGAGVAKNFTNGSIGIAFAGTTNGDKYGRHALNEKSFAWEIPVRVMYSF